MPTAAIAALAPLATQEPVPEFGLSLDGALIGTLQRLHYPPANELGSDEADPEAGPRNADRRREPAAIRVPGLNFLAGPGAAVAQVAHDFRIGVKFDLALQVFIGERDEPDAAGSQRFLRHGGFSRSRATMPRWI
jgi:hypothetical protein